MKFIKYLYIDIIIRLVINTTFDIIHFSVPTHNVSK